MRWKQILHRFHHKPNRKENEEERSKNCKTSLNPNPTSTAMKRAWSAHFVCYIRATLTGGTVATETQTPPKRITTNDRMWVFFFFFLRVGRIFKKNYEPPLTSRHSAESPSSITSRKADWLLGARHVLTIGWKNTCSTSFKYYAI